MPGCAVHLELAHRVLRLWRARPDARPFPPDDAACLRAFLFGSLGPDLGYFPGGDGLLADLAHCVRPVDLARNLLRTADDQAGRALAWGWFTHILGDVLIHPLINQAAAERARGQRSPGLTYAEDPAMHMRVELGLDAFLPDRPGWSAPPPAEALDPGGWASDLLARAYRRTYAFGPSSLRLRLASRLCRVIVPALLFGGRVVSGRPALALGRIAHRGVARMARRIGPGGAFEALTNPLVPPAWLVDETTRVVDTFAESFQALYGSGFEGFPEVNLDTGEVEDEPPSYPITIAALEALRRRRPHRAAPATEP